ncbi:MAG: hypothetical protein II670_07560 [Alphaproteobacteria bacterium]|nr:hypothetical protein [Alphaproteobacteria bacterium]
MACANKFEEQPKTAYRKSVRKDYGEIVSIDVTLNLMKEFLTAQMYVDAFPTITEDVEAFNKNMEFWVSKVKPFFEHFDEVLNSL